MYVQSVGNRQFSSKTVGQKVTIAKFVSHKLAIMRSKVAMVRFEVTIGGYFYSKVEMAFK